MRAIRPAVAALELLLVFPATLFMAALFLREVQPLAQTGRLVDWFSHHVILGLYVFLIAMPLAALVAGCAILLHCSRSDLEFRRDALAIFAAARAQWAPLVVTAATVMAAGVLAIVALHLITE